MATEIRARFALDAEILARGSHDELSPQHKQELERSMNLKRQLTRFQRQFDPLPDIVGFEGPTQQYMSSRATRRDMSTREQLAVVAYWKTHKPTIKDLARHFGIKLTSAYNLIASFKKDEDFLVKKRWKEEQRQEQDKAIN